MAVIAVNRTSLPAGPGTPRLVAGDAGHAEFHQELQMLRQLVACVH